MTESKNPLPDFDNPPVVEVALRVQFQDIVGLNAMQIGTLWQQDYKNRFPKTQEHPALEKIYERFDLPGKSSNFRFQVGPPPLRHCFLNDEESELLQIQRDSFAHNWRKGESDIDYPRFPGIKKTFMENLSQLENFVVQESLGNFLPTQCEVTYVNEVAAGDGWATHSELSRITTLFGSTNGNFLPSIENGQLNLRFVIREGDGKEPVGRLHVSLTPKNRVTDHKPVFILALIARGGPIGAGAGGVSQFLDLGHDWIVRGFEDVTTSHMQNVWGKKP